MPLAERHLPGAKPSRSIAKPANTFAEQSRPRAKVRLLTTRSLFLSFGCPCSRRRLDNWRHRSTWRNRAALDVVRLDMVMTQAIPGSENGVELVQTTASQVSQRTLAATGERAFTFLRAVSTNGAIREQLEKHGFSDADQQEGVQLLHLASGFGTAVGPKRNRDDEAARAALNEIDAVDEKVHRIGRASLTRRHPEQASYLFDGLEPARGPEAVLGMRQLLDRMGRLATGEGRPEASLIGDRAALAVLAARGVDEAERTRLSGLCDLALRAAPTNAAERAQAEASSKERQDALVGLRAWFEEWSEVARAVITRRDQLILLGLASRRKSGSEEEEENAPLTPVPPIPPVV